MRPADYAKALGLGLAVLAANLLVTTAVVFLFSQFVEPGHPPAFYGEAAPRIARYSAPAGGFVLMFLVGYVFGRRRPWRNPLAFALTVFLAYVAIDVAMGLAMTSPAELFGANFMVSLAITGAGGFAGAMLARARGR